MQKIKKNSLKLTKNLQKKNKKLNKFRRRKIKVGIYRVNGSAKGEITFSHFYWGRGGKRVKKRNKLFFDYVFRKKIYYAYAYKNLQRIKINIRLTPRNMFCTLKDIKKKKTYHIASSGLYKVTISKRYRKKTALYILKKFFRKISKYCKNFRNTEFNIITSKRLRKNLCYFIKSKIKKFKAFYQKKYVKKKQRIKKFKITNTIINIVSKKPFNGCRAKKRVRLKRRKSKYLK